MVLQLHLPVDSSILPAGVVVKSGRSLFRFFVLLQNAGIEQFVDELLHGVEGSQESLRRHDDPDIGLGNGCFPFFLGLEGDEVVADHAAREVDLTDAVSENFFLFHFVIPFLF